MHAPPLNQLLVKTEFFTWRRRVLTVLSSTTLPCTADNEDEGEREREKERADVSASTKAKPRNGRVTSCKLVQASEIPVVQRVESTQRVEALSRGEGSACNSLSVFVQSAQLPTSSQVKARQNFPSYESHGVVFVPSFSGMTGDSLLHTTLDCYNLHVTKQEPLCPYPHFQ
ncbi:hypothetical protein C0Q70_00763 [Pomacea canaliculata]|uniref:Uncharacterized protein n=1 Tax=Pomacea canaliculata TaxID=400727 RepID=A0A2T7PXJ9_POMCA|nr:hypothetical protein C0Q70_00763 [Pomacea canaliculata]